MGIQQILMNSGGRALTPLMAIEYIYDNALNLVARDVDNVQSFVPAGRQYRTSSVNVGTWTTLSNELFDYSTGALTGRGSVSPVATALSIAYGNDDYAGSPAGGPKTFSNLLVYLTGGASYGPFSPNSADSHTARDYGGGYGLFYVPFKIKDLDQARLTITTGQDDYGVFHTAFLPGRWVNVAEITTGTVINGAGPFPATYSLGFNTYEVSKYTEYSVTIPAYGFAIMMHATDLRTYDLPAGQFWSQYATIHSGIKVAYERKPGDGVVSYMDVLLTNHTDSPKVFTWRFVTEVIDQSTSTPLPAWGFCSFHTFGPAANFNAVDPVGTPVSNGWTVAAANSISTAGPEVNFLGDGSVTTATIGTGITEWATPLNPMNGYTYYMKITQLSSTDGVPTTLSNTTGPVPLDTWVQVGSVLTLTRAMAASTTTGEQTNIGQIMIATSPNDGSIVSTGSYALNSTYFDSGAGGGGDGSSGGDGGPVVLPT